MRTACPVLIRACVAPDAMAGSSRGHHAASTSGHGASRTSRRKNATQSPTRLSRPIASAQLSSVIGSSGPGSASSRVT